MDWEIIWAFDQATPWVLAMSLLPVGMFLFGLVFRLVWLVLARGRLLRTYGHGFIVLWLAFVALFAAFFIPMSINDYLDLRTRYQNSDFEIVEGEIQDFQAATTAGGTGFHATAGRDGIGSQSQSVERFHVNEIEFSYHPQTLRCHCFNNFGGTAGLQNGDYVRIAHIDGHILRLERRR